MDITIEHLESRRLLSVSGIALLGPLSKGTTHVYASGANTFTQTVFGSTTFQGHKVTRIDTKVGTSKTVVSSEYVSVDKSKGAIDYGTSLSSSSGVKTTDVLTPVQIQFPATLVVGKVYTTKFTDKSTTVFAGHTTISSTTETDTVKLVSATLVKVKVAAGTFSCYEIKTTSATKSGTVTDTSSETLYLSPTAGLVKAVSVVGKVTSTITLKKFTKG